MNRLAQTCLCAGLAFAAASLSACEEDAQATLGKSCETDQDCGEGELCDLFLPLPICASLACTSDDQECPTNYSCSDDSGDDCDPRSGDMGCPGYCECADGCSPDTCQMDVDCDFGEFCVRFYSADCLSFSCKTDAECVGDPEQAEVCEEHESCPPEGSVCVDNPRDDCDFGTDPDCTGICALP